MLVEDGVEVNGDPNVVVVSHGLLVLVPQWLKVLVPKVLVPGPTAGMFPDLGMDSMVACSLVVLPSSCTISHSQSPSSPISSSSIFTPQ